MDYVPFSNKYQTMAKIGNKYYYLETFNEVSPTSYQILTDGSNFYASKDSNMINRLICIAYNKYTIRPFGFADAGGWIEGHETLYKDTKIFNNYFTQELATIYSSPDGSKSYTASNARTVNIKFFRNKDTGECKYTDSAFSQDGFKLLYTYQCVNLNALAAALGFTYSMEKDDVNHIQLVKAELL